MRLLPLWYPVTTAATNFTTPPINVGDDANLQAAVVISGTDVVGSLNVQGAIDSSFTRGVFLLAPIAVTTSTDQLISLPYVALPYVRFQWTYTSGTGNISIDVAIAQTTIARGGAQR